MKKALITGGGGFVGGAIVRYLLKKGVECRVLGRNTYPELQSLGVECFQGDIRNISSVDECCKGVDIVFHVAAMAGIWGKWSEYQSINVTGTKNVIAACKNNDAHLVYTSTPSVVSGNEDICNGDENLPYPHAFTCHYAKSKAIAEEAVLASNTASLRTTAIRPHLIWGPGDPHIIPRIIERGRSKQLKIVGEGLNLVDISYVDNVAYAHILAAESLVTTGVAAGNAYFISQGEPVNLWQWINELLVKLNIEPIEKKVKYRVAYGVGVALEAMYKVFKPEEEPRMTRFLAQQLAKSHYFSIEKAKRDLGYTPLISTREGMNRLLAWIGMP